MDQSESENYPEYIDARDIADFDRCNLKYYYAKTPVTKNKSGIYATTNKKRKSKNTKSHHPANEREINPWILLFIVVIVIIILLVIFL
ncbi:hypothetical protein [Caldiplasma sukawensis]